MFQCSFVAKIPSKKNRWRRNRTGGVFLPKKDQDEVDIIIQEITLQRNAHKLWQPLTGSLRASFSIPKARNDLDNQITTLLDCLQKARVIENDRDVRELIARTTDEKEIRIKIFPVPKISTFEF